MKNIKSDLSELVGKTPLMRMSNFAKHMGIEAVEILAKLEYLNPAGSVKDRVALEIITEYEKNGILKPGATIIEPTSGNTGIGIAAIAAAKGYKAMIVLPDTMSVERRNLMKVYGAEIILTDGSLGMSGAIAKAEELHKTIEGSIIAGQFVNPVNPQAHFKTTGPEIWKDTDGQIDVFVAGVGTGGTITGTGKYLKGQNPDIEVVAVEPLNSACLSGKPAGAHKLQGIGAGFVPEVLDTTVYDKIVTISDEEAYEVTRLISKTEGISVGISSGAALCAASKLAKSDGYKGKTIVVILPDSGDRYLSNLF